MSLDNRKKQIIDKLIIGLQAEGKFIKQDETKTVEDKLMEIDVLLDTVKFLSNYETNVKILNNYASQHKWEIQQQTENEQQIDTRE